MSTNPTESTTSSRSSSSSNNQGNQNPATSSSSSSNTSVVSSNTIKQRQRIAANNGPEASLDNLAPLPIEPIQDRVVESVPPVPIIPLGSEHVFDQRNGKPHLGRLKEHLTREGRLTLECALRLVAAASRMFAREPNMLDLRYPVTVCGDIHGQFFDLLRLFEVGGDPKETQYLFLGDYVDRGYFSTEVVLLLYAHKLCYPNSFFMLRGNHECRQLTSFFNFKDECVYKYNIDLYDAIMNSFDHLPLAAMVNRSFFCVHGGLSPDIITLEDIHRLSRHQEIPREGPICDLLWSDPFEEDDKEKDKERGEKNKDKDLDERDPRNSRSGNTNSLVLNGQLKTWFQFNDTRQCSFYYGVDAVKNFLSENQVTSIIRAHEAQVDGYKMHMVNRTSGIPRVITIFSAPNYCDVYRNKAACLKFDHNILNIKQFVESAHPYYLPNYMDVFQWSLPFVAEKITDMLVRVLEYDADSQSIVDSRGSLLRKKVMAVTRLMRMYRILREENENIIKLKTFTKDNKVPQGVLTKGAHGIKSALSAFESAKYHDKASERRPSNSNVDPNNIIANGGNINNNNSNTSNTSTATTPQQQQQLVKSKQSTPSNSNGHNSQSGSGHHPNLPSPHSSNNMIRNSAVNQ